MLTSVRLILVAAVLKAGTISQADMLNASWWKQAHAGEQIGFVLGFYDCPRPHGAVQFATSDDYRNFLDSYLDRHSTATIASALSRAHLSVHAAPPLGGGEEYPEHHGWPDGEWWGDATHGDPDNQIGYVEGYLACEYQTVQRMKVRHYIAAPNRHFRNERNEHDKIANVLQATLGREKQRH